MTTLERAPIVGVSVALWHADRVLLVRRARSPYAGLWSFPGGKVRHGERLAEAALRELGEETGMSATVGEVIATIDVIEPPGATADADRYHYVLVVMEAGKPEGELAAGDDASAAGWFAIEDATLLPLTPETATIIERRRQVADLGE
jgi:ADP-ribose pyrophosphatase YjhB (NUDIX family)